jgi:hypothetical protein
MREGLRIDEDSLNEIRARVSNDEFRSVCFRAR